MRGRLLLLVVIGGLSFSNSLGGPFHYDDLHSVQYNPHIRSLSWIPTFYVDPSTFSGQARGFMYRPLLLTTFASDYALWGHHDGLLPHQQHHREPMKPYVSFQLFQLVSDA